MAKASSSTAGNKRGTPVKKRTSIGLYAKPNNKSARRKYGKTKYRGQGR